MTDTRAVQINRDPFARATLMRHVFARGITPDPCRWCGQPKGKFIYFWLPDDKGSQYAAQQIQHGYQNNLVFCSVGCWRSHNS